MTTEVGNTYSVANEFNQVKIDPQLLHISCVEKLKVFIKWFVIVIDRGYAVIVLISDRTQSITFIVHKVYTLIVLKVYTLIVLKVYTLIVLKVYTLIVLKVYTLIVLKV